MVSARIIALILSGLTSLIYCNDDITLPALQTLIQQHSATIQKQSADLQAALNRLTAAEHTIQQQATTILQQAATIQHQATTLAQDAAALAALQARLTAAEHTILQQASQISSELARLHADEQTIAQNAASIHTLQTQMAAVMSRAVQNPAFMTTFSALNYTSIGAHGIVKFNYVPTNIGNGYNASTGIFRAPYSGIYAFFLNIRADDTHTIAQAPYIQVELQKSPNTRLCLTVAEGPAKDYYDKGMCFSVTHLKAGEQVYARQVAGSTYLTEYWFSSLAGFMVQADP